MKNRARRSATLGLAMFVAVALVVGGCGSDGSDASGRVDHVLLEFSFEDTAAAQTADGLTMKPVPEKGI